MSKVIIEFVSRPKAVFEKATLSISDKRLFIVKEESGKMHLYPFENVLSACEDAMTEPK